MIRILIALWLLATPCLRAADEAFLWKADKPFLWKIESGKATAYLLGSLHAASADLYPLDARIWDAYAKSDILVVEANVLGGDPLAHAKTVMPKAMYPAGDTIDRHISKAVLDQTAVRLKEVGLSLDGFQQMKPWIIAMTLTMFKLQKLGIHPELGIDLALLIEAQEKKKPILELESVGAQVELLASFTDKEQELFLRYTLTEMDQLGKVMEQLVAAWKAGDAAKLDALLQKSLKEAPESAPIYKKLFDDRNVKMAEKIEGYLKTDKTYFVVVGAGHLVGKNGLLDLLGKNHKIQQP